MFELVESSDWANLPDDPQEAFVALAELCTRRMNELINGTSTNEFDQNIRLQFMTVLSAAAEELGIVGCRFAPVAEFGWTDFVKFEQEVRGAVTRVRLRKRGAADILMLPNQVRSELLQQVNRLRNAIAGAELDERTKLKALATLAEVERELVSGKIRFAESLVALSILSGLVMSAVSATADLPAALSNISSLLGAAKMEADEERARLEAVKTPALIAPQKDVDDEIPF